MSYQPPLSLGNLRESEWWEAPTSWEMGMTGMGWWEAWRRKRRCNKRTGSVGVWGLYLRTVKEVAGIDG